MESPCLDGFDAHSKHAPTLALALQMLARFPEKGFTFVQSDGTERLMSFPEVAIETRRRAGHLLAQGLRKGDHLAIIIPEGDEFVLSFLAATLVGIVPIPMYPPLAFGKLDSYIASAAQILNAADACMLLTTRKMRPILWSLLDQVGSLNNLISVDMLEGPDPGPEPDPSTIHPDDVAFIQFTSGSTAIPKGVVVRHRSLAENCARIVVDVIHLDDQDRAVSWLPMYHDMGLIGCVVAPVFHRIPTVFIPTLNFVKHPAVWMETMHRHRGTLTFAPNFAFALATRRTPEQTIARLDLSHVKVIGCGAEPNHAATMRAFFERFRSTGLPASAVLPSYGMAEATLAMGFCKLEDELRTDIINADVYHAEGRALALDSRLEYGAFASAPSPGTQTAGAPSPGTQTAGAHASSSLAGEQAMRDAAARASDAPAKAGSGSASEEGIASGVELVSCGWALAGHSFAIIDADGQELPDRTIGEVVFRGPSIAAGYYKNPEATRAAFTEQGLRTGDVGYLVGGELFLTGRKKDIIILNGRNYDPQSIEWAAADIPGIRKGSVIAFSRPGQSTEELVVVAETRLTGEEQPALQDALRKHIQETLYLSVAEVVFLEPGMLPKTSSGKLQRSKARLQYLNGTLGDEGIRTIGGQGQKVVLARHLAKSFVSRVRHEVRSRTSGLRQLLPGGQDNGKD